MTTLNVLHNPDVFLGGSCNPTTWRVDTAIPFLEAAGISYYNPQRDDWTWGMMGTERIAKDSAYLLLFVIDPVTRGLAAMNEAVEYLTAGRLTVVVALDIEDGTFIEDGTVTGRALADYNRSRDYLRETCAKHDVPIFASVDDALAEVLRLLRERDATFAAIASELRSVIETHGSIDQDAVMAVTDRIIRSLPAADRNLTP